MNENQSNSLTLEEARQLAIKDRFVPPPPHNYAQILADELGVDPRTVRNAIQGKTLSGNSMAIRKAYMHKYVEPYI